MQKYVIALYIRLSLEDYKYDSIALHHAFAGHGAAGMLDQQLIPAVQIAPAQGAQFPAAQAGGQCQQVIYPIKQWFLQDAL